jgi:outer membrane protein assembly factor BamB
MLLLTLGLCCASAPGAAAGQQLPIDMRPQPGTTGTVSTPGTSQPPPGGPAGPRRPGNPKHDSSKPLPASLFPLEAAWVVPLKVPISVTPAYDESSMYVCLSTGDLVALSISSAAAAVRWTAPKIEATFPLTADGQRVYAATDEAVEALEASTGKPLWHRPVGGKLVAPPVARAGWLILALENGDIRAVRGDTGEEVWKLPLGAAVKAEPLIDGDRLYLSPENNQLVAVNLLNGKVTWQQDQGAVVNSVAAFQNGVYVGTTGRMFYAVSDRDGTTRWKWRVGADTIGRSLFNDQRIFVIAMDNTIRAFGLDNGGQRWRQPLDFRPRPGALRIDQTIVVASYSPVLRGFQTENGKPSGAFTLPVGPQAEVAAPLHFMQAPSFLDDLILVVTLEGDVVGVRRQSMPVPVAPTILPGRAIPDTDIVWPLPVQATITTATLPSAPPPLP